MRFYAPDYLIAEARAHRVPYSPKDSSISRLASSKGNLDHARISPVYRRSQNRDLEYG